MAKRKVRESEPVLEYGALYFADNGRCICRKCAGASALYTGRDISGQRVERLTVEDVQALSAVIGKSGASCERGCTRVTIIAGPDSWPAHIEPMDDGFGVLIAMVETES